MSSSNRSSDVKNAIRRSFVITQIIHSSCVDKIYIITVEIPITFPWIKFRLVFYFNKSKINRSCVFWIIRFSNDIVINDNTKTIRIELNFKSKFSQEIEHLDIVESSEGTKEQTFSTTYERNPRLRAECIKIHGCVCSVCGFDFEKSYGPLGKNFCHVHHIRPLSEVGQSHTVSSRDDMIPVCPNCHAMLHRTIPALLPDQLIKIINARS